MPRNHLTSRLALPLVAATPISALAHTGVDGGLHHGFLAGIQHPLTGADHLTAMLALGVWSALVARRAWPDMLWAPASFLIMLIAGAAAGLLGVQPPAAEPMIAVSLLVFGLLVATRLRLAVWAAGSLAGVFAFFHGVAHGQGFARADDAALTLAGMLASTVALLAVGIAFGWAMRQGRYRWVARAAGGAVALFGVALIGGVA